MTVLQTRDGRFLQPRPLMSSGTVAYPAGLFGFSALENDDPDIDSDEILVSYSAIYRRQPLIAAVVDKLARRIATLPFDSYQRTGTDGLDRQLVRGDSLDTLLRHPLPRRSTVDLLHQIGWSLLTHGNALVAKVRLNGPDEPPTWLFPLDWSLINAYAAPGQAVEWWSTVQFDGEERFIAASEVLHFAWAGPHGEVGVSPLEKLGVTIRLEDAAQRYQTSAFRNGVRPGGVVTLPQGANPTPEVMAATRATIEAMHKGVDNAFRVGLLAPGADWKPMSFNAGEAELIDQRRLNREEVGMVYDLAGPLMNDLTHGTYSNVTELNKGLYRDVLPPWLALIEHTLQVQLLDSEPAWLDRFVAFDLTDKLKGDPVELSSALKVQVEAGLVTRNEARRVLNLPPVEDEAANVLTMNVNNQAPIGATDGPGVAGAPTSI